jgi:O-antigen ligase
MKKTVTTLMVASLVGNIFPAFNIAAIFSLFPLYFVNRESRTRTVFDYGPVTARKVLLAAYLYWTGSYLITGAPIENFFSFDFLRFDGALFIAYIPLLLAIDLELDPQFIRWLIGLFLTSMSLVALLGLAEFVDRTLLPLGLSRLPEGLQLIHNASLSANIFHGFFRAHNAAGAIYAMAALLAFALLAGRNRPSLLSWPAFWLATNVTGLILTQSRTAYVAFVAAILLGFFLRRGSFKSALKYGGPILVPLLACLLIQPTVTHRTEAVSDLDDPNIVMRFAYYQRAINEFTLSPIFGTGFARYNDQLKIYSGIPHFIYFATGGSVENDDLHAHNSYLHFLAEGGIVGLALMVGVWIATFRWAGKQKLIFEAETFGHCLAQGIQACIILEFFMSFTEHMMGTAVTSLTIFTMVCLLLNLVGWKYRIASLIRGESLRVKGPQTWPAG